MGPISNPDVRLILQTDIVMCFIYNISATSWWYCGLCYSDIDYLVDNVTISECPVGNILYTPDNNKDNIKLKLTAEVIQEWINELIYT